MRRFLILTSLALFALVVSGYGQSNRIIDDIYVTPNDVQMVNEIKSAKSAQRQSSHPAVYRNGAREIVFIDQHGNRTTAVSDTVYVVDGEVYADSVVSESEDGYYLHGFKGSKSDFEYAERIRRFHNPRYTITIADPDYNDIYFLDNDYWNVYVDGMYATITPTWNNPYWWNYQWAPYSYSSWAWRYNWGYPYYSGWRFGGYYGWRYPYHYGWYGGYYDPWYSPWYGGYYGWNGYYGWDYPYYGGWGYYGGKYTAYNRNYDMGYRRGLLSSERYSTARMQSDVARRSQDARTSAGRSVIAREGNGRYTHVSRALPTERTATRRGDITTRTSSSHRSVTSSGSVDVRTRTGVVRGSNEWNSMRGRNSYSSLRSGSERASSVINRTGVSSDGYSRSSSSINTRRSSGYESTTRNSSRGAYDSHRSSSRSYESNRSSSFGGSSRSSSGGSYGGGSSRSSGSSSSGNRR